MGTSRAPATSCPAGGRVLSDLGACDDCSRHRAIADCLPAGGPRSTGRAGRSGGGPSAKLPRAGAVSSVFQRWCAGSWMACREAHPLPSLSQCFAAHPSASTAFPLLNVIPAAWAGWGGNGQLSTDRQAVRCVRCVRDRRRSTGRGVRRCSQITYRAIGLCLQRRPPTPKRRSPPPPAKNAKKQAPTARWNKEGA